MEHTYVTCSCNLLEKEERASIEIERVRRRDETKGWNLEAIMHRRAAATLRHLHLQNPKPSLSVATLATTSTSPAAGPDDLTSEVEKIYRILRRYHSEPSKLSLALQRHQEEQQAPFFLVRPHLLERVLLRCGPSSALSFPFFTWWSSRSPPSPHACNALLRSLCRSRRFDTAWALLDDLHLHHPHLLHPDLFLPLIRAFASSRMASRALLLLDHDMPSRFGCSPDPRLFSSLLDALCKNGSTRDAAALFDSMRDRFPPTIRHFTSLLHGWCRESKLLEAKHVLVQMKNSGIHPDVVVYNTLLAGLTAAGRIEDGYHLLLEMRSKGCDPNTITYTTLMAALCSRNRIHEAMRVLVEMRSNGCTPDAVTYATLLGGLCRSPKLLPEAYKLLEEVTTDGSRPLAASAYLPLMVAHERQEQLEECLELMEKMRKHRCNPDLSIYNVAIRLSCKLGELKQASSLWEEIEASELTPGVDTLVLLINGFARGGSPVEACGYMKEMVGRGLWSSPHYGTLKVLLNSLLRDDKLQLAEDIWRCLVDKGCELNVCAWTVWIHALFSSKHVKLACNYCIEMMEAGLMPQADTFAKLMRGLKKLYNRHVAAEITEKVRKLAAEKKVSFKMYKRRGVRLLHDKAKAKAKPPTEEGLRRRRAAARRRGLDGRESSVKFE